MDLGLNLKIPFHMDGTMSGYFLMMNNKSPDGLWHWDEEQTKGGHNGGL